MAPIKFDEKFREKLEERNIVPSELTWDRLGSELDKIEKTKNKKPFWWLGLAASFIGVLIISNLFFKSDTTTLNQPVIVDEKYKNEIKQDVTKSTERKVELVANEKTKTSNEKTKTKRIKSSIITNHDQQRVTAVVKKKNKGNTNTVGVISNSISDENFQTNIKTARLAVNEKNNKDSFEVQKINEVVAKIQKLKATKNLVTDAEIDALLNEAEQDVYANRKKENSVRVVNANNLLFEVENELEQSFRARVFETIKAGYKTVRTAVVERKNN